MQYAYEESRKSSVSAFLKADKSGKADELMEIYKTAGMNGMTDDEVETRGWHPNSIHPSRSQLVKSGLVVAVTDADGRTMTRPTKKDNPAVVYGLAELFPNSPKGKQYYKKLIDNIDYDSPRWKELRRQKERATDSTDEITGIKLDEFHLHHLHYNSIGEESVTDVMVLGVRTHDIVEHIYKQRGGSLEDRLRKMCIDVRADERKKIFLETQRKAHISQLTVMGDDSIILFNDHDHSEENAMTQTFQDIVATKLADKDDKPFLFSFSEEDMEWGLSTSPNNRKISRSDCNSYSLDMINGKWTENDSSLLYDQLGRKRNGHHRAHALIDASKSLPGLRIPMWVRIGVSEDMIPNIDRGRKRSLSDQSSWHAGLTGMTPHRQGILKSAVLMGYTVSQPSTSVNWWAVPYKIYLPALQWVDTIFPKKIQRITTAGVLAVFARAYFTADKVKLSALAYYLSNTACWPENYPDNPENKTAAVLYSYLLKSGQKVAIGGKPRQTVYRVVEGMIQEFLEGRVRKNILIATEEVFATDFQIDS